MPKIKEDVLRKKYILYIISNQPLSELHIDNNSCLVLLAVLRID